MLAGLAVVSFQGWGQADPYLEGRACMIRGEYGTAVNHLQKALTVNPGETEILFNLGVCYFRLYNNPMAREYFYETEKRRKGMGSLYLARTETRLGHPELALKYLREHLDSRYRVPEKEILLDEELSTLEGDPGWQHLWNEKEWYTPKEKDFQEALFLKENGDELEAINRLNSLEKDGFDRSRVETEKAQVYALLGNRKAARTSLQSAVKSDVRNLDALLQLSHYLVEDGEPDQALAGLDRVIRQEPDRFDAYLLRARARSATGDLKGAEEDLDLYLLYFPDRHEGIYLKGLIQFDHGKYLDALQSFNRALEMDSGRAEYYFARGRTYAATGTTRYAEKDMSMALDLDPYNGEIWFEKGKLSDRLGDRKGACHCYQNALRYGIFEAGELYEKRCR